MGYVTTFGNIAISLLVNHVVCSYVVCDVKYVNVK